MTETRTSRANTPRSRAPQRPSQAARRASSVPAVGSKRPEFVLDCVLMTPRKRKRTTSHEDPPPGPAPQPQGSRLGAFALSQKKLPARAARSRARSTEKDTTSSSSVRSRSQKRAPSPPAPTERTTRRRAASTSRTTASYTTEPSTSQRRRTSSRASVAPHKPAPASISRASASSSRRNKGKARVSHVQADFEASSQPDSDIEEPAVPAPKRRRLSPPQFAPDSPEFSPTDTAVGAGADNGETLEEDFQMLDMPDDASLPWVAMDPQSTGSAYVPPGLNALIEDMKRALVLQMSARQKAEALHAEEAQRRRELEREAARLAAANRALEEERRAWTASAAEALACTLESALVADRARGAYVEEMKVEGGEDAEMEGDVGVVELGRASAFGVGEGLDAGLELGAAGHSQNTDLQDRGYEPVELVMT